MGIKLVIIHKQNGIIVAWKNCMEKYRGTSSARFFFGGWPKKLDGFRSYDLPWYQKGTPITTPIT
jgi:hypothetical protein